MSKDYMTGEELLADWNLTTKEDRLTQAVLAMLQELESLHVEYKHQSLAGNIDNPNVFCSCADAYRMGIAALERSAPSTS